MVLPKEDIEILSKVLLVGIDGSAPDAETLSGDKACTTLATLGELRDELNAEQTAGPAEAAERWKDISRRKSLVDKALVGRLSSSEMPALDYLVGCFRRCTDLHSRKSARDKSEQLEQLFAHVVDLAVFYSAMALLNPSMFTQPPAVEAEGSLRLLRFLKSEAGLPSNFLARLTAKLAEDGALSEVVSPIFAALANEVRGADLTSDFKPLFLALRTLVREKKIGAVLAAEQAFLPAGASNGAQLERDSLLGGFFAISCFPTSPQLATRLFPELSMRTESSMDGSRLALNVLHSAVLCVTKDLLKNADAKEGVFRFIAAACSLNGGRGQQFFVHSETQHLLHPLGPDFFEAPEAPRATSHDGFLLNLGAVLLQLCDEFATPNSPHASKIDATYLLSNHRLQLGAETKLCATADDVMYWLDPRNPNLRARYLERMASEMVEPEPEGVAPLQISASFGTVSEYFFLALRVLHLGLLSSFELLENLMKTHHRLHSEYENRERELQRIRALPNAGAVLAIREAELARLKGCCDGLKRYLLCYRAQLTEPQLLARCVRFYRLVARWLVSTAMPPAEGLPLPATVPRLFAALPEFVMDDIAQFLKHLSTLAPQTFEQMATDELYDFITLIVTFIGAPKYVKNPYLRATFTRLLRFLVPETESRSRAHASDRLADVFHIHPLAQRHLAPAVMQFFVDIEFTGSHTGAYDKYDYRHEMTQVLEYFWSQPEYHAAMVSFARETKRFVRFVNMLINDSIFCMDEALSKLASIRTTQQEMADEERWGQLPERQRRQRRSTHQQEEGAARYFMQFTNEVLHMLQYLSSEREIALIFMLPELVQRIAGMMNHFLERLVGKKSTELKVENKESYNFHPRKLLVEIATTVVHFARFPEFVQAVVRDERGYKLTNLRKAIHILAKPGMPMMPREGLVELERFGNSCETAKQQEEDEEAELGDVPEDFLDPITMEIMEDPMTLPSGKVIDRPTINRHLLSDETDPFSRQRCTPEMLVPNDELKARIVEFRETKKQERKAALAAAAAAEASTDGEAPMELG